MGENYAQWLKRMKEEIQAAINSNETTMNPQQEKFLPTVTAYQQEKVISETKNLVIATWALAIVTIVLVIITYFKP